MKSKQWGIVMKFRLTTEIGLHKIIGRKVGRL